MHELRRAPGGGRLKQEPRLLAAGRADIASIFAFMIAPLTVSWSTIHRSAQLNRRRRWQNFVVGALARDFPQVIGENFTNEAKERWATRFKILAQKRAVVLPRDRDLVAQVHAIKRRVLPSGKVSFDAERNARGHADKFWAVALACQQERVLGRPRVEIGVRILG